MRWRSSARGVLLLLVTLATGIAIGVGYERRRAPDHDASAQGGEHMIQRLDAALDLDAAQEQAISAVFARRQGMVDSTWHAMRPHIRAALDSAHEEVVLILRPDQVAKFRQMVGPGHHSR